ASAPAVRGRHCDAARLWFGGCAEALVRARGFPAGVPDPVGDLRPVLFQRARRLLLVDRGGEGAAAPRSGRLGDAGPLADLSDRGLRPAAAGAAVLSPVRVRRA